MSNHWINILKNLPLSKSEQEIVKRFSQEPEGKSFLPISDILRTHGLTTEALELLTEGMNRFPTYSVARVVLIRELYENGMIAQAWQQLHQSPTPLSQNTLAQKLSFKLHLILGREVEAREVLDHMKKQNMVDHHTRQLSDKLDVSGINVIREQLIAELKAKGSEISFPTNIESVRKKKDPEPVRDTGVQYIPRQSAQSSDADGFYVVSLREIFNSTDIGEQNPARKGVELDTKTLAEIYEKQGHWTKALTVYKRMSSKNPGHDLYRNKVAEMARKEKEANLEGGVLENEVIDQMESMEIIDRQIDFFNHLLSQLPNEDIK